MNNSVHIDTVLDELLLNKITRADAITVLESEAVTDALEEIELHYAAAKLVQRYNTLQQVQQVHTKYTKQPLAAAKQTAAKTQIIKLPMVKWALRTAATVIIILSTWFAYQYATTNSSQLYSEIYEEYNPNTDRGIGTLHTHDMVKQFKAGNFTAVINTYNNLETSNNREKFMAGYAYMKNGDNKNAVTLFTQILEFNKKSQSRLYNDEAEFYAGLCFLQLKNIQNALAIFTSIRNNPDHTFYTRVSKWTITRLKWLN